MNERFVRLRNFRKGPVTYSVHGIHFNVGMWSRVPEMIQVGNDVFELCSYLRELHSDDGTQALFEVTDLAGAKTIEKAERARAEAEAMAARPTPGSISLVDRATRPAGAVAAPEKEHVDGEEIISPEEKADAEAEAAANADEAPDVQPDAPAASSKRATRQARKQVKK